MDPKERENIANYLLNHCFVPCEYDSTREKYYTIVNHPEEFSSIFKPLGYTVVIHPSPIKIVQLVNNHTGNQIKLKKYESIITIILRLLYIEKREGLMGQDDNVIIRVSDIENHYNKMNLPRKLDPKMLENIFQILKKYNIAFPVNRLTDSESEIIIMSTVMLALPDKNISEAYNKTLEFLQKYEGKADDTDDNFEENKAYQLA